MTRPYYVDLSMNVAPNSSIEHLEKLHSQDESAQIDPL